MNRTEVTLMKIENLYYYILCNQFYPNKSSIISRLERTLKFCKYIHNFDHKMNFPFKRKRTASQYR